MHTYLSFGGGVNSVALYLLLLEQGLEPGNTETGFEALFVDHGGDWPETYAYVEVFRQKYPLTVLTPSVEGESTLHGYLKKRSIVPSFMNRFCTDKFKVRVINKYVKRPCWMYLGIDAGEENRAKISVTQGIEARWPLIEREIDRAGCVAIIERHGLPVPQKSGCWFCPYQGPAQWKTLRKAHPCLFRQAVGLERANRLARASKGKPALTLCANGKTLDVIVNEDQGVLLPEFEYPPCQCGL